MFILGVTVYRVKFRVWGRVLGLGALQGCFRVVTKLHKGFMGFLHFDVVRVFAIVGRLSTLSGLGPFLGSGRSSGL